MIIVIVKMMLCLTLSDNFDDVERLAEAVESNRSTCTALLLL